MEMNAMIKIKSDDYIETDKKIKLQDIIIDESTAQLYCGREKFFMLNGDKKLGQVKININIAQICNYFEFVIHASSKFEVPPEDRRMSEKSEVTSERRSVSIQPKSVSEDKSQKSEITLDDRQLSSKSEAITADNSNLSLHESTSDYRKSQKSEITPDDHQLSINSEATTEDPSISSKHKSISDNPKSQKSETTPDDHQLPSNSEATAKDSSISSKHKSISDNHTIQKSEVTPDDRQLSSKSEVMPVKHSVSSKLETVSEHRMSDKSEVTPGKYSTSKTSDHQRMSSKSEVTPEDQGISSNFETSFESEYECMSETSEIAPERESILSKAETELEQHHMSMTSRVRPSLTTVEEIRREYSHVGNMKKQKNLYVAKLTKLYYTVAGEIDFKSGIQKREKKNHPIDDIYDFISEGANLIVMKHLALNRFTGKLKIRSMLINGEIVKTAIFATKEDLELNSVTYETTKITRFVKVDSNSTVQKLETWLKDDGKIILHKWGTSSYCMQSDDKLVIYNNELHFPLEDNWADDLQLASIFIDTVGKLKNGYLMYMTDYPEAGQLIADFVLFVLIKRPVDVIDFAIDYFTSLRR